MQCIQDYGGSSSSSDASDTEPETAENTAHLRPIDTSHSVAKTLTIVAAPHVVPMVNLPQSTFIDLILN